MYMGVYTHLPSALHRGGPWLHLCTSWAAYWKQNQIRRFVGDHRWGQSKKQRDLEVSLSLLTWMWLRLSQPLKVEFFFWASIQLELKSGKHIWKSVVLWEQVQGLVSCCTVLINQIAPGQHETCVQHCPCVIESYYSKGAWVEENISDFFREALSKDALLSEWHKPQILQLIQWDDHVLPEGKWRSREAGRK